MRSSVRTSGSSVRLRGRALALAVALALGGGGAPAAGAILEGVRAPDRVEVEGSPLELHRMALFRWMRLLKVYVASLYLPPGAAPERVLQDVPKRLEIHYFRGFTAEQFAESTSHFIAKNVATEALPRLQSRIDELNRLYRDVSPGDRYALTYAPGLGTELALNGEPLGRVEGAEFAAAVFSIWLGREPIDTGLREALLGLP